MLNTLNPARFRSLLFWGAVWLGIAPSAAFPSADPVLPWAVLDVELIDQDGTQGRLVSDFIGDRLAAVAFTYTTCTTVCPMVDQVFKRLQEQVSPADTVLLTLSIDPGTDSARRLHAHAHKLGAKPGWRFLTGPRAEVIRALQALEVYAPDIYQHSPTVLVLDGRRKVMSRLSSLPPPGEILRVLGEYRAARAER